MDGYVNTSGSKFPDQAWTFVQAVSDKEPNKLRAELARQLGDLALQLVAAPRECATACHQLTSDGRDHVAGRLLGEAGVKRIAEAEPPEPLERDRQSRGGGGVLPRLRNRPTPRVRCPGDIGPLITVVANALLLWRTSL